MRLNEQPVNLFTGLRFVSSVIGRHVSVRHAEAKYARFIGVFCVGIAEIDCMQRVKMSQGTPVR